LATTVDAPVLTIVPWSPRRVILVKQEYPHIEKSALNAEHDGIQSAADAH
jgi:hypothetical protein